ncbi:hypothetical protein ACG98G_02590 [Megasphaera hexanoica]|uniref:hypothetical protein n=1 Tax=Megasphaera hexanoica TaxID=1675036 RepID=UPI0013B44ADE|nr:hypothetical protein [Megasphaera hexanoica]
MQIHNNATPNVPRRPAYLLCLTAGTIICRVVVSRHSAAMTPSILLASDGPVGDA